MAMLSSSSSLSMSLQLVKPSLSISNNKSSSHVGIMGRNSISSRRLVCKNSSAPVMKTTTNKLLLRRLTGKAESIPYFTTLSTTTPEPENSPITLHKDCLPFPKTNPPLYQVVGSCDGLICLADSGMGEGGVAAIWNPSTNDFKILPGSSIKRPSSLATLNYPSCGFGFDPKSQDYKMVRFVSFSFETEDGEYDHYEDNLEVYSLKTDSWRQLSPPILTPLGRATTIEGRCYWVAESESDDEGDLILCFDLYTEQFLPLIPLPRDAKGSELHILEILEFDGSLALFNWNDSRSVVNVLVNVWVLKDGSWSHVSVIRHSSRILRPIGSVGNDKLFFQGQEGDLLVYDCATREMKSLGIYDKKYALTMVPHSVVGRNSLLPFGHVCKNSSPPPPSAIPTPNPKPIVIKRTNKLFLLKRMCGNTESIPYFETLSTTTPENWPIIQHDDCLPFPKTNPRLEEVVGSCHGLICLADSVEAGLAAIWNPSTNDYKILPTGSCVKRPPDTSYNPSWGFGFDPKSQDYKMVRFSRFTLETHVEVYSLKTDSWREVSTHNFFEIKTDTWRRVSFSATTIGAHCYWVAASPHILCFDLSTEQFLPSVPLPTDVTKYDWHQLEIIELDGSLALLDWNDSKLDEFNVWVLKGGGSWSHVSVIHHSFGLITPTRSCSVGNDKLFFEGQQGELLVYDCATREMKSLGIYDKKDAMTIVPYSADNYSAPLLNGKSAAARCRVSLA